METQKITVTITEVDGIHVLGVDSEGTEFFVAKTLRLDDIKVKDKVEGYVLFDEEMEDYFIEAIRKIES